MVVPYAFNLLLIAFVNNCSASLFDPQTTKDSFLLDLSAAIATSATFFASPDNALETKVEPPILLRIYANTLADSDGLI